MVPNDGKVSWSDEIMRDLAGKEFGTEELKDILRDRSDLIQKSAGNHIAPMLFDEWNCKMYDNVRPRLWMDPGRVDTDQNQIVETAMNNTNTMNQTGATKLLE